METSNTKTSASAQPTVAPTTERKGGFIPGAVAAQGCCGTTGSGAGCCGEAATAVGSAAAAAKPAAAPIAVQSGCCGAPASSCCS